MSDVHFICEQCGSQDGYLQETIQETHPSRLILSQQLACGFCNHLQWNETWTKRPSKA